MWIARDKDGSLFIYRTKPRKYKEDGQWGDKCIQVAYNEVIEDYDLFSEVKWEDEEPTELILKR